ncbi:sporulation peptidase YabG [Pelotomaculum terephthalicicum JT]|uniref:sporulation peptidase YabG n=1 Tax=Pelotomaculum TaxID=191373 RepID=UPI001F04DFDD|nr:MULTISPECIES: sporulation peptidase YabG [Pelotomaculum]MCG9968780.1 sporulation peptidase YabG [Pelotomaculum terephthalicicum JT]
MGEIKQGDIVGRKSYNSDVFFKVVDLFRHEDGRKLAYLKGLHLRLYANAPLDDLIKVEPGVLARHLMEQAKSNSEHMKRIFSRRVKEREIILGRAVPGDRSKEPEQGKMDGYDIPGTVLHIDGDNDYLELCLTTYKQLSIPANGYCIDEDKQPAFVEDLLKKHSPDLLVLTGHDGFIKGKVDFRDIDNYYSSKYFVEAIKAARRYEKSRDDLVIFAGACQSHYEAILTAGANFASSPQRVLIHAYDPVFVVEKIAYTSIYDPISIKDIIAGTVTGFEGIGGMETRGKYRMGIPKSPY